MYKAKLNESLTNGEHKKIQLLQGRWSGNIKSWFGTDEPVDESEISGEIKSVLDGRFALYEYKSFFQGKPTEGLALIGYFIKEDKFQFAWADTFHTCTAIMFSESKPLAEKFEVQGIYYGNENPPKPWGWRTHFNFVDSNTIEIICHNTSPEGIEHLATHAVLKRSS